MEDGSLFIIVFKRGLGGLAVQENRLRIMQWVGSEVLPHEADLRRWLRKSLEPFDVEDVIQESYARIAGLDSVTHIQSGRAYFYTVAKMIVLERLRRARIVKIESVVEIDALNIVQDVPSPERMAAGRRELDRVRKLIEGLPERTRRVIELRKIEGLSQREAAMAMNVAEHTIEYESVRGLRLILKAMQDNEEAAETALRKLNDEQARDSRVD